MRCPASASASADERLLLEGLSKEHIDELLNWFDEVTFEVGQMVAAEGVAEETLEQCQI